MEGWGKIQGCTSRNTKDTEQNVQELSLLAPVDGYIDISGCGIRFVFVN